MKPDPRLGFRVSNWRGWDLRWNLQPTQGPPRAAHPISSRFVRAGFVNRVLTACAEGRHRKCPRRVGKNLQTLCCACACHRKDLSPVERMNLMRQQKQERKRREVPAAAAAAVAQELAVPTREKPTKANGKPASAKPAASPAPNAAGRAGVDWRSAGLKAWETRKRNAELRAQGIDPKTMQTKPAPSPEPTRAEVDRSIAAMAGDMARTEKAVARAKRTKAPKKPARKPTARKATKRTAKKGGRRK